MKYVFIISEDGSIAKRPVHGSLSLEDLHELVGGQIEHVDTILDGVGMLCDEEGKLKELGINKLATELALLNVSDVICGPAVLCAVALDTFEGFPQHRASWVRTQLRRYTDR